MRKQDRIAQHQQQRRQPDSSRKPSPGHSSQPPSRETERMRGHADEDRPMRQPGERLPLPD
jgi:hypothetical protein